MGRFFKALINRIKIFFGKAADSIEDTVGEAKLGIEEAKESAAKNQKEIARLMGANKSLQTDMTEAKDEIAKYEKLANKFAEAGDVANAEAAIKKMEQAQRKSESLTTTVEANNQLITQLRERLEKYKEQINEAETDIVGLEASHTSAKMREQMVNTSLNEEGLGAVGKLRDKVEEKSNYATALEDLNESADDKLEAAARELEKEENPILKKAREAAAKKAS
jgi:phage shock protein A